MPLSDYSELLEWMKGRPYKGDIVEIGVLIGNGTRQLAEAYPNKTIWAVDVFNIYEDKTRNQLGVPMYRFYESEIGNQPQFSLFKNNTAGLGNVEVFSGKSSDFPAPPEIFFSVIDGGHSPKNVKQDYEKLRHGKFTAFHDYQHDIPELTEAVDEITIGKERHELPGWLIVGD